MKDGQTRYTYPMAGGPDTTLTLGFAEEYYMRAEWSGLQMKDDARNRLNIYRRVQRALHRDDIGQYNPQTREWNRELPRIRLLRSLGWEQVLSVRPRVTPDGKQARYVWNTPAQYGLYREEWTIATRDGLLMENMELYTRIHPRSWAPVADVRWPMQLMLTPWPAEWPAHHEGFPIAVGVIPYFQGPWDPYAVTNMRNMLSSTWVEIVEGWRIEDDYQTRIDPWEYVYLGLELNRQFLNWFYGKIDTSALLPGTYKLRLRLHSAASIPGISPYQDEYWKTIKITVLQAGSLPSPVYIAYDCVTDSTPGYEIGCNLISYNTVQGRYFRDFMREAEPSDPRPLGSAWQVEPFDRNNQLTARYLNTKQEAPSSPVDNIDLPMAVDESFAPLVAPEGDVMQPADYEINGTNVHVHDNYSQKWIVLYMGNEGRQTGSIRQDHGLITNLPLISGKRYLKLTSAPNYLFYFAASTTNVLFYSQMPFVTDPAILAQLGNPPGAVRLDMTPLPTWVCLWYSFGPQDSRPQNLRYLRDESLETTIALGSDLIMTLQPIVAHGTRILCPQIDYQLVVSGKSATIEIPARTAPVQVWYN